MANAAMKFAAFRKSINRLVYLFRTDREVAVKARTLLLSLMVVGALGYGGYILLVEPQKDLLKEKNEEHLASNSASSQKAHEALANAYHDLKKRDEDLKAEIGSLQLEKGSYKDLWRGGEDKQIFFPVVLALHPSAPSSLVKGMVKLGQLAAVKQDNLTIFPVNLEGMASYDDLLAYLEYLERRPEVGVLDKLSVTAKESDDSSPPRELFFRIQVGRIEVEDSP